MPATGVAAMRGAELIGRLEDRLGLPPVTDVPGESLLAYRECLAKLDDASRFYHASFRADPIGVTRTLLEWRALFYEQGWSGSIAPGASRRLCDMAEVEQSACQFVPACLGQRINRVCDALESGLKSGITGIELMTPLARAPKAWQRLLAHFEVVQWRPPRFVTAPLTDLARVQSALLGNAESATFEPIPLVGDGSLLMVRAVSRDLSADAVARYIGSRNAADIVLLAQRDGIILDNALERGGLPRVGFQHFSPFRGITQVLALVLKQLWRPLSARSLLQLLQHPVAPLAPGLRRELANIVVAEPGIGSPRWRTFVEGLESAPRAAVLQWLEQPRFDPKAGAPIDVVAAQAHAVGAWIAGESGGFADVSRRRLYAAALAQARALASALEGTLSRGRTHMPRAELESLLLEVVSQSSDPGTAAEAGHAGGATHPAEVEPVDELIWWDLRAGVDVHAGPFSRAERIALADAGAALPSALDAVTWHREDFLRVLACARKRLVLVVHPREGGRHLFESLIEGRFCGVANVMLEAELLAGSDVLPGLDLPTAALLPRALPAARGSWQLPADVALPERPIESYSSLDKLFHHPHIWVLNYAAKLRAGRVAELPDGPLLYGNLAHALFERFFQQRTDWAAMAAVDVAAWVGQAIPALIDQSGAVLGELGRGVDHQRVIAHLERALPELVLQLRAADVVSVVCEAALDAPLIDSIRLRGAIDLWVTRRDGAMAVVDIKWGGEDRRMTVLADNRHLQLVTYAYLVAANGHGSWPEQAFFIVSTANLLTRTHVFFPQSTLVGATASEDEHALWARALASYRFRRSQLDRGLIDVLVVGTEDAQRTSAPADALFGDTEADRFDPYGTLTGWDVVR